MPAIKSKGSKGISEARDGMGFVELPGAIALVNGLKYVIAPPMPEMPFIMSDRVHIALSEQVRVSSKISSPKFWFSLTREGAEKEFDCQTRLADKGLGFGALCAGGFVKKNGQAEVDGLNRPTGGVYLIHDPEAKTVSKFSQFSTFRTATKELKVFPPAEHVRGQKDISDGYSLNGLIDNYIDFAGRIADVKARALLYAGIAKHSSHDGNYWYVAHKDLVQMSDNDNCLLLNEQPREMHGIILLRDYSTYLGRVIRQLTLNAFDINYFGLLDSGKCRPVHRVLENLFQDTARLNDIHETATTITKGYLSFVLGENGSAGGHTEELFDCVRNFKRGISSADQKAGNTYLSDQAKMEWEILHIPFYKTIISELYKLCRKSQLSELGFTLPEVCTTELELNLEADLKGVIETYREEFAKDIKRNRGEDDSTSSNV